MVLISKTGNIDIYQAYLKSADGVQAKIQMNSKAGYFCYLTSGTFYGQHCIFDLVHITCTSIPTTDCWARQAGLYLVGWDIPCMQSSLAVTVSALTRVLLILYVMSLLLHKHSWSITSGMQPSSVCGFEIHFFFIKQFIVIYWVGL